MRLDAKQLAENATLFSLWANHIVERRVELSDEDNEVLAGLCKDYCGAVMDESASYKHRVNLETMYAVYPSTPALLRYFFTVKEAVAQYIALYGLRPSDIDVEYNTFANVEGFGDWALHHGHYGNQFVVTYYPAVYRGPDEHERGGVLQFLPNDPMVSTWMLQREGQAFELKPEKGTQVVMPAHVRHGTTPLFDKTSYKIALVTNVRFTRAEFRGTVNHMTEDQILASQGVGV